MKILQVHNYYQYAGGEDIALRNEYEVLSRNGHEVIRYIKKNKEIEDYSLLKKYNLFLQTAYSKRTYDSLIKLLAKEKPDICHVHNTLPLISPSVFYACNAKKIPVVQTLHNYRLLCANAYLFRDGKVCEECIGKSLYRSLKYGCYRNSRIQTLALARMVEKHKKFSTWSNRIDAYIALTNFSKEKFVLGGLPKEKISVKPNFLFEDPGMSSDLQGEYFLFAGRLDVTKGIKTLLAAVNNLERKVKIKVAGEGNLKNDLLAQDKIIYLGQLKHQQLIQNLKGARSLILPSLWYEGFPMLIVEAFACGKPVIASNLGAMAELITDGKTGLLFKPGNAKELTEKINWAYSHKKEMQQMGINARKEFEEKYTADRNYKMLMDIYNTVIERKKKEITLPHSR